MGKGRQVTNLWGDRAKETIVGEVKVREIREVRDEGGDGAIKAIGLEQQGDDMGRIRGAKDARPSAIISGGVPGEKKARRVIRNGSFEG